MTTEREALVKKWRAQPAFQPNQKITILVRDKKRGDARKRFDLYRNNSTVAEYVVAQLMAGWHAPMDDMRWDYAAGFIDVR